MKRVLMSTSFYSIEELKELGLKKCGNNVFISKYARIYKPEMISIGNNVRIDDFCILSGGIGIEIGDYVHIAAYALLFGGAGIEIHDFAGVASRSTIYSEVDDHTGESMMGPLIPTEFRTKIIRKKVILHKHSGLGPHSILLPGANLLEGAEVGANSFVTKPRKAWTISIGSPARVMSKRKRDILELEKKLRASLAQ